ncbi:MAG: 50S ribosomal protein L13 [Parcubacteria group bacterium GW2011_GWD2_38_12]|uniref:Large ribosomal subunit protein uL13 n=1 Tax=Candidatus Azambacteria bacterium RIFCSPLOWO2_01_FULL_37_9 TaxID=1797297 RepID=A0A1F5C5T7_9BACT|nr:MAG: 50S ribosomal protein L13 [Parcubacteria group bacterium GW2011_GWC2_36_17]KKQ43224.1 MAG: 50S ribosomal protein L13 [Parcubacteria group bacterium GW2011_GWE2_37_8]KKQ52917.1 MAG: 50S ribosomal protein L13 [Parcubacteria group bacterium GW2011_GWD2_38_12]KKQ59120.1 MAG: 50S ribosomal protein L13 [Parcubacteria group bacterium GW2011_GWC1_38_17]KKQ59735.1 MAG: 50S ribosomal protein L13 [Parcubacteria group bacterium GW2011_GWD1_38_16]KKQ74985.1 MAG: 50S ribosomal protein L13 [Microgeno
MKSIERKKHTIDAKDQVLGRLATRIATLLRGKHKVIFSYQSDNGDFVEVVNADKIVVTGKKMQQKTYYRHSGWIGNLKKEQMDKLFAKNPAKILELAVSRMLPKNKLRAKMLSRLSVTKINADENKQ